MSTVEAVVQTMMNIEYINAEPIFKKHIESEKKKKEKKPRTKELWGKLILSASHMTMTYPNAESSFFGLLPHTDNFIQIENFVRPRHPYYRAVTESVQKNAGKSEKVYTYHWASVRGKYEPYLVKYTCRPLAEPTLHRRIRNQNTQLHEINYKAYIAFKDSILGQTYKISTNHFSLPKEDEPPGEIDSMYLGMLVSERIHLAQQRPEERERIKRHCMQCLTDILEYYEEKYKYSYNEYYLQRMFFWKHLKYEHMSDYHRVLMAVVYKMWSNFKPLEYRLREAYEEKLLSKYLV